MKLVAKNKQQTVEFLSRDGIMEHYSAFGHAAFFLSWMVLDLSSSQNRTTEILLKSNKFQHLSSEAWLHLIFLLSLNALVFSLLAGRTQNLLLHFICLMFFSGTLSSCYNYSSCFFFFFSSMVKDIEQCILSSLLFRSERPSTCSNWVNCFLPTYLFNGLRLRSSQR